MTDECRVTTEADGVGWTARQIDPSQGRPLTGKTIVNCSGIKEKGYWLRNTLDIKVHDWSRHIPKARRL